MARLTQMRIYTINKDQMAAFLEVWSNKVLPLRQQYGFSIDGAWVYAEANKFVWLLSLEGTIEDWNARDLAYLNSPECQNMNPSGWSFVAHSDETMLNSVLESA